MRRYSALVLYLTFVIAIAAVCTSLKAQTPSQAARSTFGVSIAMKQSEVPAGQAPWVTIHVKMLRDTQFSLLEHLPHVEGEAGELPRTMYHRQRRHESGVPPLAGDLHSVFPIEYKAGESTIRNLDLMKYYDLSTPGKYSVYVEYRDESGNWQRTNTVQFTMQAPAQ